MAFTEFCCRSGGSNMNAGTVDGSTEPGTAYLAEITGGDYGSSTNYTAPIGSDLSQFTVGRWVSVFTDGNTTPTSGQHLVGRITAVNTGTRLIQVSPRIDYGATQSGTGNKTIRVGGAWAGPSGSTEKWPFLVNLGAVAVNNETCRVNHKNDQTYGITSAIVGTSSNDPIIHQGYSTTFGDGGKATMTDTLGGASYILLTLQHNNGQRLEDWIFDGNGTTGTSSLVSLFRPGIVRHCVFKNSRGSGLVNQFQTGPVIVVECEAYNNNLSGTTGAAGLSGISNTIFLRCISHNNTGAGSIGIACQSGAVINCISANNVIGLQVPSGGNSALLLGNEVYNNSSDGLQVHNSIVAYGENNNFVKNGGWGISKFSKLVHILSLWNNAFGSGTQANTSGTIHANNSARDEGGTVTLPANVTPWNDPANGDFRITLAECINDGRGFFEQTVGSAGWSTGGTVSYPDIGAAQHLETSGGGGGTGLSRARAFSGFH